MSGQHDGSYAGRILFVDLTTGDVHTEPTGDLTERFLGGRGIDQWLLYSRARPGSEPLDPESPLVLGAGVLCGTLAPAAARVSVAGKNYATGGLGFSNAGGFFAPALKYAGFDHVVISGRAPHPVYLFIDDESVMLRDASDLWGRTTWETERRLRGELGEDVEVGSIGIAGEKLVKSACIIFGRSRAAAHCGFGAVMGAKQLKAVAVRGSGAIAVHDDVLFRRLVDDAVRRLAASSVLLQHQQIGTLCYPEPMNDLCMIDSRNWSDDHVDPERLHALISPYLHALEQKKVSCATCPIFCSHVFEVAEPGRTPLRAEGFEANAPIMFGTALGIEEPAFILRAHTLCSQHGLDIDAAGSVLAWAFDCYDRGLLTRDETDGLELRWGDWAAAERVLEKLARREGLGELLAKGARDAARELGRGSERLVAHLKGHEHFEALRAAPGWALGTAVALRGGGHLDGAPGTEFGDPWTAAAAERTFGDASAVDPTVYHGKGAVVSHFEKLKAATDALGLCYFTTEWYDPDLLGPSQLAALTSAATGRHIDGEELLEIGDRIHNVGKAFNTRHARFGRADDMPVARFFEESIVTGARAGTCLDRGRWEKMLDEYYEAKQWDPVSGRQTHTRLVALGLDDVADDLTREGWLPSSDELPDA